MALKLTLLNEIVKLGGQEFPLIREFYGRNVEQMPALREVGRVPMNVSQLMQRRLDFRANPFEKQTRFPKSELALFIEENWGDYYKSKEHTLVDWELVKTNWMDNHFQTGDAVAYHPEGDVLIDLDSQYLRNMNSKSPRNGEALLLNTDRDGAFAIYEQLKKQSNVVELKKGNLGKIKKWLPKAEVKTHPVWRALARGDQALLDDYADYVFAEGEKIGYTGDNAMGVFLDSAGDNPKMRMWLIDGINGSCADGGDYALRYSSNRRFAGLVSEALSTLGKGVKDIQKYTRTEDLQALDKSIEGLEATVNPELLEGIRDFRKKL